MTLRSVVPVAPTGVDGGGAAATSSEGWEATAFCARTCVPPIELDAESESIARSLVFVVVTTIPSSWLGSDHAGEDAGNSAAVSAAKRACERMKFPPLSHASEIELAGSRESHRERWLASLRHYTLRKSAQGRR